MHKFVIAILFSLIAMGNFAQIPSGYYDIAGGLTGQNLRQALHDIIDSHNSQSYSSLWYHFEDTDKKTNGKVWDMYSDVPGGNPPYQFTFGSDQCGNYGNEGDCYNREHSWPKSWFNEGSPMYTDLFHLYPTDGYVNGQRNNYPFGETEEPTWTSLNGSKKGPSSFSTMTGTVFEPIDEYKGDFARTYFYMCTRYYNEDGGWDSNELVNGANLTNVGVALMMKWHYQDPVSQKEIDRNNEVYDIQNNRNPYIDHPEYADLVWGDVDMPPFFIFEVQDTIIEGGQQTTLPFEVYDDNPSTLVFEQSCLFCTEDFVDVVANQDGTAQIIANPTNEDVGSYDIVITVSDGTNDAIDQMFTLTVEQGNGVNETDEDLFSIFPNPSNNKFTVQFCSQNSTTGDIMVFDVAGKQIFSRHVTTNQIQLGSGLESGIYYLIFRSDQTTIATQIIKQ